MYYICVENNRLISILDYEPNVPDTVSVTKIDAVEFAKLDNQTHYFDTDTKQVLPYDQSKFDQRQQEEANKEHQRYLSSTDWKVMRHIRQKALGIPTSLSEAEYLELEAERQRAAEAIIH